ncbi:MinD/ParA family protein [Alteribacter natronophilus]|uniref:MinD/ParA family protein n=1 Tax=Alteribacter natronophilus TaxID=2583810 RepID=UPI0014871C13|nr:MinD/ParA family protein [Alteribacter natronophilus]
METDQASALRKKMKLRGDVQNPVNGVRTLAVVSGKGGVGKTNFAVNFAASLALKGCRVLIIDLDIGMANVDIILGESGGGTLPEMVENNLPAEAVIHNSRYKLSFISGGNGLGEIMAFDSGRRNILLKRLGELEGKFDLIIYDFGAGAAEDTLEAAAAADEMLVVTTPEPAAVTDAYSMLKLIHRKNESLPVRILVNKCRDEKQGRHIFNHLSKVCRHFLLKETMFFGSIPKDENVWKAVCSQTPYTVKYPGSKASRAVNAAADRYLSGSTVQQEASESFTEKLKGWLFQRN